MEETQTNQYNLTEKQQQNFRAGKIKIQADDTSFRQKMPKGT